METYRCQPLFFRCKDHIQNFFQCHLRTIVDLTVFFRVFKKLWIDQ